MKRKYLLLVFLLLFTSNSFSAATYSHKLSGGVDKMYYYVDKSISSYTTDINNAVNNWIYTGWDNPIYMYPVSSNNGTAIDFYYKGNSGNCSGSGTLAYTKWYRLNSGSVSPNSSNWEWAETNYCTLWKTNTYNGFSTAKSRQGTVAHEIGHAMGLAHNTSSSSIMTQVGSGRKVYKVDYNSNKDIINKYGWRKIENKGENYD